jgi:hypothetical protein
MTAPIDELEQLRLPDDVILAMSDEDFLAYRRVLEAAVAERHATVSDDEPGASPYVADPVGWAQDVRKVFLWSKQREVLRAVVDHPRVAVKSCHGVGKTFTAGGVLIPWWVDTHPRGSARVLSTAPSNDQVKALLWHEVNQAHAAGGLPGRVNQTEWWIGTTMVAFGRKPADNKPGAMVGLHSEFNLVVLDEADGVADELWTAADALATNDSSRILAIGNPDTAGSRFEKACKPGSGWHVITISAFDSPNFTDEPVPDAVRRVLVAPSYEAKTRQDHGVESPVYLSKVLGEFPKQNANSIIPLQARERAQQPRPSAPDEAWPVELGVDVAAGGDRSVVRVRRGSRITPEVWRSRHDDPVRLLEEILVAQRETQATSIKVDSNGVGWALTGQLRQRLEAIKLRTGLTVAVHAVNVGEASAQPKRFKNLRAELWWTVRELCQDGALDLSYLDAEDPLLEELIEPRWFEDAAKRVVVEPKDEIRKRLGRSPDDADAGLLAIYVPPRREKQVVQGERWAAVPARR